MGNYQGGGNKGGGGFRGSDDRGGSRPPFQKKNFGGGDRGGERSTVMHKATCSECGNNCEVPFRPSGEKPVYCSNCFGSKKEGGDRGGRPDFANRGGKRDFTDRGSSRPDFRPTGGSDTSAKQLAEISQKLDRLIHAIDRMSETKKETPATGSVLAKAPTKKEAPAKASKKKVAAKKK